MARKEAERVGKYMIRPLLSLERLSLDEREAKVCYRYGEGAEEMEQMDYLKFTCLPSGRSSETSPIFPIKARSL